MLASQNVTSKEEQKSLKQEVRILRQQLLMAEMKSDEQLIELNRLHQENDANQNFIRCFQNELNNANDQVMTTRDTFNKLKLSAKQVVSIAKKSQRKLSNRDVSVNRLKKRLVAVLDLQNELISLIVNNSISYNIQKSDSKEIDTRIKSFKRVLNLSNIRAFANTRQLVPRLNNYRQKINTSDLIEKSRKAFMNWNMNKQLKKLPKKAGPYNG